MRTNRAKETRRENFARFFWYEGARRDLRCTAAASNAAAMIVTA
jgi:hypothetical protein